MGQAHKDGAPEGPRRGLFTRLAKDVRGNTLAIVGAALVPLTGMIGSGVDMSRAYMAKTRLQSACDAGALAGRRIMQNDEVTQPVIDEARRFFNFNFPQGLYGTEPFTAEVTRPSSGTVRVTAATNVPTAIMGMFGVENMPINVTCDASLNFVNTEIMLVLDVTGSMLWDVNGNPTSNVANQRITALRDAVMALYDELAPIQAQLAANNMRLRYGIVPYSSSVNVGHLIRGRNADYLVNSAAYQSRQPEYELTSITEAQCATHDNWSWRRTGGRSSTVGTCTYTSATGSQGGRWTERFLHDQIIHDTSRFKTGASTPVPTRTPGTTQNSTWAGCIEERDTVSTITSSSGFTIPPGAFDLDINRIPDNDATRWRPLWPEVSYSRSGVAEQVYDKEDSPRRAINSQPGAAACPTEARQLAIWTRGEMLTYVNSLNPVGGTYHDIGMIWGARLISTGGIFADGCETFNGMPCSRHVIFMTDGQLAPNPNTYTSYGVEELDQRVTGSANATGQSERHMQRFRMICNQTRGMNVNVWVIAFGVALDQDMRSCASNANQASTSANRTELIARFRQIGSQIGALRLTQ